MTACSLLSGTRNCYMYLLAILVWSGAAVGQQKELMTISVEVPKHRVALVIGNSAYTGKNGVWSDLEGGPIRDAEAIRDQLKKLDFDTVLFYPDVKKAEMENALRQFQKTIRAYNEPFALIYFAGHGVQAPAAIGIEDNNDNYLIPVDSDLEYEDEAPLAAISLTTLKSTIAGKVRAGVIILDACRNNGLKRPSKRGGTRGLARVAAPKNILIAYSTAAGHVAPNRANDTSQYTETLVSELAKSQPLSEVFRAVQRSIVRNSTQQEPEVVGILHDAIALRSDGNKLAPMQQPSLARLIILTEPRDANVKLPSHGGRTYSPGMELDPGNYSLLVSHPGYETYTKEVRLDPGNNRFDIALLRTQEKAETPIAIQVENVKYEKQSFTDRSSAIYFADLILRTNGAKRSCDLEATVWYVSNDSRASSTLRVGPVALANGFGQARNLSFKVPRGAREFRVDGHCL